MQKITNEERRFRLGFAILREMLFPVVMLVVMICFSRHIEHTGNSIGYLICIVISLIVAIYCIWRLFNIWVFPDKIRSKEDEYSVPYLLINLHKYLKNLIQPLKNKVSKWRGVTVTGDSANCSEINEEQKHVSTVIEWDKYPTDFKQSLLKAWNDEKIKRKSLRLAAPIVFLIKNQKLHPQPNYLSVVKFFAEKLSVKIDQTQLTGDCELIMRLIEAPDKATSKSEKSKLAHYLKVEKELSKVTKPSPKHL